jgi:26S proteasome regulatory subunit N9
LKLIRGSLDQVAGTVDVSWVQPRVLEGSQLDTLAAQFNAWTNAVGQTEQSVDALRAHARQAVSAA